MEPVRGFKPPNLMLTKQPLYQLSYTGIIFLKLKLGSEGFEPSTWLAPSTLKVWYLRPLDDEPDRLSDLSDLSESTQGLLSLLRLFSVPPPERIRINPFRFSTPLVKSWTWIVKPFVIADVPGIGYLTISFPVCDFKVNTFPTDSTVGKIFRISLTSGSVAVHDPRFSVTSAHAVLLC